MSLFARRAMFAANDFTGGGGGGGASYESTVLADSPLGFWMLDEASGSTAADQGSAASDGTYVNSPTLQATGPSAAIPYAVTLNGTNQRVTVPGTADYPKNAAGTVEIWAKWSTTGTTKTVLTLRDDGSGFSSEEALLILNRTSAGQITFRRNAADRIVAGSGLNDGAWHHIAATWDPSGDASELFVDGVSIGTGTAGSNATSTDRKLYIGSNNSSQYVPGAIAGVAVFGSVLSSTRIAAHHSAGA